MAWSTLTNPSGGVSTTGFGIPVVNDLNLLAGAAATDARAASVYWTAATSNPVIGNGTAVSLIRQDNKWVDWTVILTMGSTSAYGTGAWQLVPPVTLRNLIVNGVGRAYTAAGTAGFPITFDVSSTTLITLRTPATTAGAIDRSVGAAAPIAWGTGAILSVQLRMEAA